MDKDQKRQLLHEAKDQLASIVTAHFFAFRDVVQKHVPICYESKEARKKLASAFLFIDRVFEQDWFANYPNYAEDLVKVQASKATKKEAREQD